jgi:hypothetical protein
LLVPAFSCYNLSGQQHSYLPILHTGVGGTSHNSR